MTPALERDISETKATLAKIAAKLGTYSPDVQADLGAHLRAVAAQATEAVDGVKRGSKLLTPGLKQLLRDSAKPCDGGLIVMGSAFSALFAPCTSNVLDQGALKEAHPKIYAAFVRPIESERLNFSVRKG